MSPLSIDVFDIVRLIGVRAGKFFLKHIDVIDEMEDTRERARGARHIRYAIMSEMI